MVSSWDEVFQGFLTMEIYFKKFEEDLMRDWEYSIGNQRLSAISNHLKVRHILTKTLDTNKSKYNSNWLTL